MKKLIIAASILLYTAAMLLGFIFIPVNPNTALPEEGKSANDGWVQRHVLVDLTEVQQNSLREKIGINIKALADQGYGIYSEEFYAPDDWRKEVHKVAWCFEKIYCDLDILVHQDEIGWERTRSDRVGVKRSASEIIGMTFVTGVDYLAYDDVTKGVYFIFRCSENVASSVIFQDFLRIFFDNGEAA